MVGLGWNTGVPEIVVRREQFPSWSWVGWEHIDNLTVPWGPGNNDLMQLNQGVGFAVKLSGLSGIVSLDQYALAVLAGSDFTEFAQCIFVTGPSSKCIVKSAWDIEVSLPPEFRRKGSISIVRMMGIPETNYGGFHHSPLSIVHLGCHRSSGLFFGVLILQKPPGSDDYIRVDTLSLVTTQIEPERQWAPFRRPLGPLGLGGDFRAAWEWQVSVKSFFQNEWELKEFKIS